MPSIQVVSQKTGYEGCTSNECTKVQNTQRVVVTVYILSFIIRIMIECNTVHIELEYAQLNNRLLSLLGVGVAGKRIICSTCDQCLKC